MKKNEKKQNQTKKIEEKKIHLWLHVPAWAREMHLTQHEAQYLPPMGPTKPAKIPLLAGEKTTLNPTSTFV